MAGCCPSHHPAGYGPCTRRTDLPHLWHIAERPVHTDNPLTNTYYATDVYPFRTKETTQP